MRAEIPMIFMPHDVGHYLGLAAHDSGGEPHTLKPGMVVTIEPGLYWIDGLLDKAH